MSKNDFLPVTYEDMDARGWEEPDFVFVSGDAYVDHPSFGTAIITRVLEAEGWKVCVLPQPSWQNEDDFKRFGKPKYGFMVQAGVIDSMVNHYTVAKKKRSEDLYSPGGRAGMRPDRATIVYANRIRRAFPDTKIVIGGVEASLRRFAHYDYWDDRVRFSYLVDSGADVLVYGMGERIILDVADYLKSGAPIYDMRIRGTCVTSRVAEPGYLLIPSAEEVAADKAVYAKAFKTQYEEQDPVIGKGICQKHGGRYVIQNPPALPLSREELDSVYDLPYTRAWHPMYDSEGGVPGFAEVKFSITSSRGCFGACNYCALTFHQGRIVTSRSKASIIKEAELLSKQKDFKGYIHDIGGPTANFRRPACSKQLCKGACKNKQCLFPEPCKNVDADHREYLDILKAVREIPKIKKVFVRSGIRFDYMLLDKNSEFMDELVQHHVSGQLKVAPEHVSHNALKYMGKPDIEVFERFKREYDAANKKYGLDQYLVPYFMSSHPGCSLDDAIELALYLKNTGRRPEQVQDFYPTPGTLSTAMFYTGIDPRDMTSVYVPRSYKEKQMQRALMQYYLPQNREIVAEALRMAHRTDLIGFGKDCLVPPRAIAKKSVPDEKKTGGKPKHNERAGGRVKPDAKKAAPGPRKKAENDRSKPNGTERRKHGR